MADAIYSFQPSLHTEAEFVDLVLDAADELGIYVEDLQEELEKGHTDEYNVMDEILVDVEDRFFDAGYYVVSENDSFIISDQVHEELEKD